MTNRSISSVWNWLLGSIMMFLICACSENTERIQREYYPNGQLKAETHILDEKWHGMRVLYYPNGKIEAVSNFNKGENHGKIIGYYESGVVKAEETYSNGLLNGIAKYYNKEGVLLQELPYKKGIRVGWGRYYRSDGTLSSLSTMVVKSGKEEINQVIKYDENGIILQDSSYYLSVDSSCDTLQLGDTCLLDVHLVTPMMKKDMLLIVGGYDEFYNLIDKSLQDTITGENFKASYKVVAKKKGVNIIRGRVDDFKIQTFTNSDTVSVKNERNIYFTKQILVR